MKTLHLTTWERVQLLQCIPPDDVIVNVRKHLRVMDVLELSDDDRETVGFDMVGNTAMWQDAEHEFEIQLEDADYVHLLMLMKDRPKWPTSRNTDTLLSKFEV